MSVDMSVDMSVLVTLLSYRWGLSHVSLHMHLHECRAAGFGIETTRDCMRMCCAMVASFLAKNCKLICNGANATMSSLVGCAVLCRPAKKGLHATAYNYLVNPD